MTEPLLRRLHARGERLTVGALPWVAPVYRAMPGVSEVIEFPFAHGGLQWQARRNLARQLRGHFDTAYVCPNSLKSALLPWLAGIPRRVGRVGEMRWGLINHRLPNPPKGVRPPMVPFYAELSGEVVAGSGAAADKDRPFLTVPAERVATHLQRLGLAQQGYAVCVPGAEYGPAKRWPAEHFAQLIARAGLPVRLLGSGKDAPLCEAIAAQAQGLGASDVASLAGKTTLDEAMSLIHAARWVVTNDSGLMHVAAAFDVPQVAVFGSSSPHHTPPLSPLAQVIWLKDDPAYQPPLTCSPCFQRECPIAGPLGQTRCLRDVTPQRVWQTLAQG